MSCPHSAGFAFGCSDLQPTSKNEAAAAPEVRRTSDAPFTVRRSRWWSAPLRRIFLFLILLLLRLFIPLLLPSFRLRPPPPLSNLLALSFSNPRPPAPFLLLVVLVLPPPCG
eukprot:3568590-Pyramimonas_sp.AAC.1